MSREDAKRLMKNRGDANDWLLTLADCEARTRHTQPDVADDLRDLRHELREVVMGVKPGPEETVRPDYYWTDGMTTYNDKNDQEVTCPHCKKTFRTDPMDATCRLCRKFFRDKPVPVKTTSKESK